MTQHRPVRPGGEVSKLPVEALLDGRDVPLFRRTAGACVKAPVGQLRQRGGERDAGASFLGLLGGSKDAPPFLLRMAAAAVTPRPLTQISGINYSTGKKLDLTLYAAQ